MPETFSLKIIGTQGSDSFSENFEVSGSALERATPTVPAAKSGSLSTRTDNDTGVATMASGHGFTTGNKVDLFWSGGSRRQMDATVSGNAVTLDGGSGDNLPALNTAVTAMVPVSVDFTVEGDDVVGLAAFCPARGWIAIIDDEAAEAKVFEFESFSGQSWISGSGITNPLAGVTTASAKFSHASTSPQTLKLLAVY